MKKILISAAVILAALFVIQACTREGEEKHEAPQTAKAEAFEQLNVLIDNYTKNFFEQHGAALTRSPEIGDYNPVIPEIDRKKGWFRRFLCVFMDAIGGLIGGSTGTILGWKAGYANAVYLGGLFSEAVKPRKSDDSILIDPDITPVVNYYTQLSSKHAYDSVGIMHNRLLIDINDKYGDEYINDMTLREIYDIVYEETAALCPDIQSPVLSFDEFNELYGAIYDELAEGDITGAAKAATAYYPNLEHEITSFTTFIVNYYQLENNDDGINYAAGFRDVVSTSAIPSNSKNVLQSAISTAVGSGTLWQENKAQQHQTILQ